MLGLYRCLLESIAVYEGGIMFKFNLILVLSNCLTFALMINRAYTARIEVSSVENTPRSRNSVILLDVFVSLAIRMFYKYIKSSMRYRHTPLRNKFFLLSQKRNRISN